MDWDGIAIACHAVIPDDDIKDFDLLDVAEPYDEGLEFDTVVQASQRSIDFET